MVDLPEDVLFEYQGHMPDPGAQAGGAGGDGAVIMLSRSTPAARLAP
jgi:hypothetical protein